MVLFRFFQKWRPRGAKSVWRFILGFTAIVLAFLVMRNNSTEQSDINSRSDLEQYVVKNESDSEDGWSPLDTVWSDAMSDGKFYLGSRDNISIFLWKPGKNPKKVKIPFRRTKKRVKRPGPKMAGKSRASANEKPVLPEGLEKSMYFNVTYVGKRFAKTSSSTWNNWPINIEALKEIRKQASSLHPLVGMDNKEIIPSSKQVLTCGKGLPTCKLEGRNAIRHYQTCAVVGNSGILAGSLCGGEIDAHDYVIRFGVAPTVRYKNDVGSKRNITFLNKDILLKINESLHLGGSKDVYTPRLKRMNGSILMFTTEKRREWTDDIKCLIEIARKQKLAFTLQKNTGNPAVTIRDTVKATMPDLVEKLGDIETTGTLALFVASTFCSRINLYGFYPFHKDTHERDISYHYYTADSVKEIVQDEIRKFSAQHAISRRFDKLGVIRHVIDRCQQTPLADERSPAGSGKLTSAKGEEKSSEKFKGKDAKDKSKK